MKILWVKSGGLLPLDTGGKIRSYQILHELSRRHELTIALFYSAEKEEVQPELQSQFPGVICWAVKAPNRQSWAGRLAYAKSFLSTQPHSVARFCRPEMLHELRRLVGKEKFDLIVCDFVLAAPVIPWDAAVPKILFTHNVEAAIWRRHFQVTRNPVWKAVWWREYRTTLRMERKYARLADHVLTVSEADRQYFCDLSAADKVTAIPTGVDVAYFQPFFGAEEANALVFTGSMDWQPNEDGILFFCRKILPLIRKSIPNIALWVVGRNPSPAVRKLSQEDSAVHVTGRVDDIRPYVAKASVYIVPLRVGSGTRLKIFEAMAMAKPVVSTTVGAEGLPVSHGKDVFLEDEPAHFADRVVTLLQDKRLRENVGSAARKLVEEHYSWNRVAADCEKVFSYVMHKAAETKEPKEAGKEAQIKVDYDEHHQWNKAISRGGEL
ncbi:MAG TPA: glycosyltransferase [Terriglobales bacterium]|nr:glycosyltransferase [Terriglobales bacterium]